LRFEGFFLAAKRAILEASGGLGSSESCAARNHEVVAALTVISREVAMG
jgi:hypothetical protein